MSFLLVAAGLFCVGSAFERPGFTSEHQVGVAFGSALILAGLILWVVQTIWGDEYEDDDEPVGQGGRLEE